MATDPTNTARVSKVIYGGKTLIDLTADTVTSDTLIKGTTAHDKSGKTIVGTYEEPTAISDTTIKSICVIKK